MTRPARVAARCAMVPLTLLLAAWVILAGQRPAHAEPGDRISSYDISYVVDADGSVQVTETITYLFSGYGRHGIYRDLVTQVQFDDDHDRRYEITDMHISSPTGADTSYTIGEKTASDGRTRYDSYRIGSASSYVDATETYVLSYDIRGALNAQQDGDTEFYWNATGNSWDAQVENVTITAEVPGGATQVACFAGPRGYDTPCSESAIQDGKAVFGAPGPSSGTGWGVTIDVGIAPSKVEADKIIVDKPTYWNQNGFTPVNGALAGAGVLAIAAYGVRTRRAGRDMRFVGIAPGIVPSREELGAHGGGIGEAPDDGSIRPPVAFSPPRGVSPAEASYLRRPGPDDDQLSATVLDLAQRGVLRVIGDRAAGGDRTLQLIDPSLVKYPHEAALVKSMFASGSTLELTTDNPPGVDPPLYRPNRALRANLGRQMSGRGWFRGAVGGTRSTLRGLGGLLLLLGLAGLAYSVAATETSEHTGVGIWAMASAVAGLVLLAMSRGGRGQGRTATGRAVMDQVEGFETYLRTAEADQLRFEEGEDIFSKYLPWAVVFDVAERWTRICSELSAAGRIPAQPGWYYGPWDPMYSYLWISSFNNSMGSAASAPTPVPSASSGGNSGFSGFGGGGFSGGGGGGGGGGSW